jgi:hyaluronan synthase
LPQRAGPRRAAAPGEGRAAAQPYLSGTAEPGAADVADARAQMAGLAQLERISLQQALAASTLFHPVRIGPAERIQDASPGRHARHASRHYRDRVDRVRRGNNTAVLAAQNDPLGRLTAGYSKARTILLIAASAGGVAALAWRHATELTGRDDQYASIWAGLSVVMIAILLLAWLDRPKKAASARARELGMLRVTVNVPVYNEDPEALRLVARALARQTRPPQRVEFVDDGSDKFSYDDVRDDLVLLGLEYPDIEFRWVRTERTPDSGKRAAQAVTFRGDPQADVFATIDSDTVLESRAIEEGLKPFADPRVQSVAAILLVFNAGRNLLTGLTEIWLAVYQLGVRAAWSRLGCVLVNSGGLAFYRAGVVRDALPAYLGETFAGRKVSYSDDAMLTFFALLRGRTVQQPTCFAFTIMPEKTSHHVRQQLRWMRGNVIRTFWWFRYLSPLRLGWWLGFIAWTTFTITTGLMLTLFVIGPALSGHLPAAPSWPVIAGLSYLASLRALLVKRGDQRTLSRLAAFAASPLITIWCMTVLRVLRLWSLVTCLNSGWGTRTKVEVTVGGTS